MRKLPLLRITFASAALVGAFLASEGQALAIGEEKAGPFMGNLKLGPAIRLDDVPTQIAIETEIAYAVDRKEAAYLGFNPQFQFSDGVQTINLTGTFQYDFSIPKVRGLYLYPKINLGLGLHVPDLGDAEPTFTLQPEFGVKFNFTENFHAGAEPFSLPIYLGDFVGLQYRMFFYAGFDI